jgi:hypothetical protein
VFEHSSGMPLLRHWSDGGGAATFYGGLPATTLVVRSISTVYNYDYIMVGGTWEGEEGWVQGFGMDVGLWKWLGATLKKSTKQVLVWNQGGGSCCVQPQVFTAAMVPRLIL